MKLPVFPHHASRFAFRTRRGRRREDGIAVIVVLALIVMVLIFLMGNVRTFHSLDRELKLLEKQQTKRLQVKALSAATNVPAPVKLELKP